MGTVCGLRRCAAVCAVLLLVAAGSEEYTPSNLSVSEVLARARAARGAPFRNAVHIVSHVMSRDEDYIEETDVLRGDYVTRAHDAEFNTASGSYEGTDWRQNANGVVVERNADQTTSDPYVLALSQAGRGVGGRVLGVTASELHCVVIELDPRAGLVERRYYDAKTFVLRRVETTGPAGTSSITYDDFRPVYGRLTAFTATERDSHNGDAVVRRITSFDVSNFDRSHFAIPQNRPVFDLGTAATLEIPSTFTPAGIIVRVDVAGRGLDFELDSGAATSVIDTGTARGLGLVLHGSWRSTFGGEFTEARTMIDGLQLGNIRAQRFAIAAIPFSRELGQRRVVGLLGADFFASARIFVDFKQERLVMERSDAAIPAGWTKVPIDVDELVPMVSASFNGTKGRFVLDLGADDTILYKHYFDRFHPNAVGEPLGEVSGIGGRRMHYRRYTFSRLDFGDLSFADVSAAVVDNGADFEAADYDGLLGRTFLSNFLLRFDYANHAVYVKPLV